MRIVAQATVTPDVVIPVLTTSNPSAMYADNSVISPVNGKYYLDGTKVVKFSIELIDSDLNRANVNVPLIKLVAERHADDRPSGEEIYLTGSIIGGVLNVTGQFGLSTNWKITADRNNRALDRLFVGSTPPFHLSFDTLDFLS